MTKRRQNAKVSPLLKKGKGKRKRQRFEQDGGDMSPALFKMVEWRPKAKYREMGESPALFKMAERKPNAKYREMREVRWRQKWCSKQDRKCSSSDDTSVDRISMLPDELLGSILCHITLKEQIATSILSRRWRYLWTLTTRLDFDGIDSLLSIEGVRWCRNNERRRNVVLSAFEKLKTISLNRVGVDDKALEFFLHNCPLLEDLSVSESSKLLSLRVTGPFPSLKRLEINRCLKLDSLEICDVNLVCFKYRGREIHVLLRNLPMLAHVSVPKSIFEYMKGNVAQFSSILEQLEIVNIDLEWSRTSFLLPVETSNLKQLEVVVRLNLVKGDESLLWIADLIQSAPHLQKFVLESGRGSAKFPKRKLRRSESKNLYPHMKEVEFVGFCGVPSDLEFIFHFVDNAVALKKILINTKKTHELLRMRKFCPNDDDICKDVCNQLEKKLALEKPRIKLEFLITPS